MVPRNSIFSKLAIHTMRTLENTDIRGPGDGVEMTFFPSA